MPDLGIAPKGIVEGQDGPSRVAEDDVNAFPEQTFADDFRTLQHDNSLRKSLNSPAETVGESRSRTKKVPPQHRDGTNAIPAVPPYLPGIPGLSSRTPTCPVVANGRRPRPGLLTTDGFQLEAPEGFSTGFCAPAHTVPGSLCRSARLLVSINAFTLAS